MALRSDATVDEYGRLAAQPTPYRDAPRAQTSAVSWGAILAGAAAAAALSLILLILGTGLGLSAVSPWAGEGVAAATFGVSTILWLTLTSLAASGIGGYLAGRLRTKCVAKARKASAYAALWLFVSLLGGAFVASLAATFGGRLRDA